MTTSIASKIEPTFLRIPGSDTAAPDSLYVCIPAIKRGATAQTVRDKLELTLHIDTVNDVPGIDKKLYQVTVDTNDSDVRQALLANAPAVHKGQKDAARFDIHATDRKLKAVKVHTQNSMEGVKFQGERLENIAHVIASAKVGGDPLLENWSPLFKQLLAIVHAADILLPTDSRGIGGPAAKPKK